MLIRLKTKDGRVEIINSKHVVHVYDRIEDGTVKGIGVTLIHCDDEYFFTNFFQGGKEVTAETFGRAISNAYKLGVRVI